MDILERKIENCKIKLFKSPLTFFGILSFGFIWKLEENLNENIEGFVSFNPNNLSKTLDKQIHINKKVIERENYSYNNMCFLILHEIQHIIRKHALRGRNKENPNIWSLACEHCVDRDSLKIAKAVNNKGKIISDIQIESYENEYAIIKKLDRELPNCSEEEAYDWLLKTSDKIKVKTIGKTGNGGAGGTGNPEYIQVTVEIDPVNPQVINITIPQMDNGDGTFDAVNPNIISGEIQDVINNTVAEATAVSESLEQKGSQPGGLKQLIDQIIYIEVDWKIIVEKAIKQNVIRLPSNRSWIRLNKFYTPHNINIPGKISKRRHEGLNDLYILVDTSGSISDRNLKEFSGIVYESMKYFENTIVISHDVSAQEPMKFTKKDKNKFLQYLKNTGFKGRGGTSHRFCFDQIEKAHEKLEKIGIILSLTDGHSDIESIWNKYNWTKDKKVPFMVICNSKKKFSQMLRYENFSVAHIN